MDLHLYLIDERTLHFPSGRSARAPRALVRRPSVLEGAPLPFVEYAASQPPPHNGINAIEPVRADETMQQLTRRIWQHYSRFRLNMIRICCHSSDVELQFGAGLRTDADARAFRLFRGMWFAGPGGYRLQEPHIEVHGCSAGRLFVLQNLADHAGVPVLAGSRVIVINKGRAEYAGQVADQNFLFEGPVRRFEPAPANRATGGEIDRIMSEPLQRGGR